MLTNIFVKRTNIFVKQCVTRGCNYNFSFYSDITIFAMPPVFANFTSFFSRIHVKCYACLQVCNKIIMLLDCDRA